MSMNTDEMIERFKKAVLENRVQEEHFLYLTAPDKTMPYFGCNCCKYRIIKKKKWRFIPRHADGECLYNPVFTQMSSHVVPLKTIEDGDRIFLATAGSPDPDGNGFYHLSNIASFLDLTDILKGFFGGRPVSKKEIINFRDVCSDWLKKNELTLRKILPKLQPEIASEVAKTINDLHGLMKCDDPLKIVEFLYKYRNGRSLAVTRLIKCKMTVGTLKDSFDPTKVGVKKAERVVMETYKSASCRLLWNSPADLDIWVEFTDKDGKIHHIYHGRRSEFGFFIKLDRDNIGGIDAEENITFDPEQLLKMGVSELKFGVVMYTSNCALAEVPFKLSITQHGWNNEYDEKWSRGDVSGNDFSKACFTTTLKLRESPVKKASDRMLQPLPRDIQPISDDIPIVPQPCCVGKVNAGEGHRLLAFFRTPNPCFLHDFTPMRLGDAQLTERVEFSEKRTIGGKDYVFVKYGKISDYEFPITFHRPDFKRSQDANEVFNNEFKSKVFRVADPRLHYMDDILPPVLSSLALDYIPQDNDSIAIFVEIKKIDEFFVEPEGAGAGPVALSPKWWASFYKF
jgi:hypothetical protein